MKNSRSFTDYLNCDWDNDWRWKEFIEKNGDKIMEPKEREEAKRQFYKIHYNNQFNEEFVIETEQEREFLLEICKFIGCAMSLLNITRP